LSVSASIVHASAPDGAVLNAVDARPNRRVKGSGCGFQNCANSAAPSAEKRTV
jgi:hypothetical protein